MGVSGRINELSDAKWIYLFIFLFTTVAEIGDRITQPIIAVIVHWVMQIVVTGSMVTVIS